MDDVRPLPEDDDEDDAPSLYAGETREEVEARILASLARAKADMAAGRTVGGAEAVARVRAMIADHETRRGQDGAPRD